jgi:hypothetical protein
MMELASGSKNVDFTKVETGLSIAKASAQLQLKARTMFIERKDRFFN